MITGCIMMTVAYKISQALNGAIVTCIQPACRGALFASRFRGRYRATEGSRDRHTLIGIVQVRVCFGLACARWIILVQSAGLDLSAEPQQEVRASRIRESGLRLRAGPARSRDGAAAGMDVIGGRC